jgi:putative sterol carrier protein
MTSVGWSETRQALRDVTRRFVELVGTVNDPHRIAVGDWTITQVAAHVREVTLLNSLFALDQPAPDEWRPVFERAKGTTMEGVAALNAQSLELVGDEPLHELGEQIDRQVDQLLTGTADADGSEPVSWLGGTKLPLVAVLGHTTSEMFVHGRDIASAERRAFTLPAATAAVIFEAFLFELIRSPDLPQFAGSRTATAEPVSCELRLRGADRAVLVIADGRLSVEAPGSRPVDVRVSADPATMWLIMSGRIDPVRPILTGRLAVWGRRPWRLRRLSNGLQAP